MKVETKDKSDTRKEMVVTFEAAEVDAEYARVTREFARQIRIPGFRPGKAPAAMIQKRFGADIAKEAHQAIVSRAYRDGVKEAKIEVLQVVDVPEPKIEPGSPAEISVVIDVHPAITLPDYTGLPIKAGDTTVTGAEIDAVLENVRRERAEFKSVERAAAAGDYVKYGFEGTLDGQSIAELVPERPIYGTMPSTWEEAGATESLLPGIGTHLVGMAANETKETSIDFPSDFTIAALAGKTGSYKITVQEVRERVLPEIDQAFLEGQKAATIEELRERISASIKAQKEAQDRAERRRQAADAFAAKVEFPIPESIIESEAESILRQLLEQNMRRGVGEGELEEKKEELYSAARKAAIERSKIRMLLARVAEAEKMKVEAQDLNAAIYREAIRLGEKPEKLIKQLEKDRDRVRFLQQGILFDKALDFLVERSTVSPA